ncbi:phospholipase A2-like [Xyrichtys novacula]|nr:phospholipase A2-like [Xyrichtys novacula]
MLKSQRAKRSLVEFAGVVQCSTGITPLAYLGYGCYCGPGGQGQPRDETDWCCFRHDCCYGEIELQGCQSKLGSYSWTCENNMPHCDDLEDNCEKLICECDRKCAECLGKAPYDKENILWPDIFCSEDPPVCNKTIQQ